MYLNHYNLKKEPFNITPDPEFLFLSSSHKEAIAAIVYGVEKRKGFIEIVGEVGVGKTTILRSYLHKVNRDKVKPIYLFNPDITFTELLSVIGRELSIEIAANDASTLNRIHEKLIHEYKNGRNIVLIIDEAQNMPASVLENIRILSNLETSKDKLIQIVFSAQPEFEQILNRNELRQLRQRIAVKSVIRPLTRDESLAYIRHRLSMSAPGVDSIFSEPAMKRIASHSKGIPRTINILCDNSLISSYGYKQKNVNDRVVKEIISDFSVTFEKARNWRLAVLVSLLVIVCLTAITAYLANDVSGSGAVTAPNQVYSQIRDNRLTESAASAVPETIKESISGTQGSEGKPPTHGQIEHSVRIVQKGDTLAGVILARYGTVDKNIINSVKRSNPGITDLNRIIEGERIYLPEVRR